MATDRSIPHRTEVPPRGGTDTGGLRRSGGATPIGAISVPTRYLHTVTESAREADVVATIDLLTGFPETETGDHDYRLRRSRSPPGGEATYSVGGYPNARS